MVNIVGHDFNGIFPTKSIGGNIVGANPHYMILEVQETHDNIYFNSCFISTNK